MSTKVVDKELILFLTGNSWPQNKQTKQNQNKTTKPTITTKTQNNQPTKTLQNQTQTKLKQNQQTLFSQEKWLFIVVLDGVMRVQIHEWDAATRGFLVCTMCQ